MDTQAQTIRENIRQLAFRLEATLNEDTYPAKQYYGDPGKAKGYAETLLIAEFPEVFGYSLAELKEFGNKGGFDTFGFEYTNLDYVFRIEGWVTPRLQICIEITSIGSDKGRARVKQPVDWEGVGKDLVPEKPMSHYSYPKPVVELEKMWRTLFKQAYPDIKLTHCFPYISEGRVLFAATRFGADAYHYTYCGTKARLKGYRGTSVAGLYFGLRDDEALLLYHKKITTQDIPLCWGHTNLFGDERGFLLARGSGDGLASSSRTPQELDTILALTRDDLYPAIEVLEPKFRKWFRDKGKRFRAELEW